MSRWRREDGTVTAELAVCLPVLVLVLCAVLAAVSVAAARVRVADAAREVVRAAARHDPAAVSRARAIAPGAAVTVGHTGDRVTARVAVSIPLLGGIGPPVTVAEQATAEMEPAGASGGLP